MFTECLTCVLLCIYRCTTDDTAQYTVVASNNHGQASCQAAVMIKSKSFFLIVLYLMLWYSFHTVTPENADWQV